MAKTYIQKAIDKTLKLYESSNMGFLKFDEKDMKKLRSKLYAIISGNEAAYKQQVDERLEKIEKRIKERELGTTEEVQVNLYNEVPAKVKLDKKYNKGMTIGFFTAIALVVSTATIASCSKKETKEEQVPVTEEVVNEIETPVEVEEIDQNKIAAEQVLKQFSESTIENTTNTINALLANGVKIVDGDLNEENQKDLLAANWLQYYLVANIDDITTLEYANFMKEQPNAVLDNDDLIYNFREMNILLKGQMLVSTTDNKIDFSNIYQNENDAQLLNDGALIIARLNEATNRNERKEISKEFYEYIQNTILNQTDKLKYSNSAMATFINVEFGSWSELTKSSNYGYGYYPDDELEAKLMTVVSNCGMSKGEETSLNIEDETKRSLESINVIRVLDSLNERKENILTLSSIDQLYYIDGNSFGELKPEVIKNIDLTNYNEIQSYSDKIEQTIINAPAQTHSNDSGVRNDEGLIISKNDMEEHNVNPSSPTAQQEYEQAVIQEHEQSSQENTVIRDNNGEIVASQEELNYWTQQGAIDANRGSRNNNVPAMYQNAYNNGWNAAIEAINKANQGSTSSTTFEPVTNGNTETTTSNETFEDFKGTTPTVTPAPTPIPTPTVTPTPTPNPNTESKTEFVPVSDGETTIIEETETFENFTEPRYDNHNIEYHTMTSNQKLESYKELKSLLKEAIDSYQEAINIYGEIETNNMSK